MSSYQDYQKQIAELQARAEVARLDEVAEAKAKIQAIMRECGLTIADIGSSSKKGLRAQRKQVEIKYKDEATGDTWTGRGRAPKWLEGKDKNQFRIR